MAQQKADLQRLQGAAGEITAEAAIRHKTADIEAEAAADQAQAVADWQAQQKVAGVEENLDDDFDDDFDDDETIRDLESKRLAALKARFNKEKSFHAQGHGEYREICEEEFLKEVCGSTHVAVHFYHDEFFRCKILDKHLREIAYNHKMCKFLKINSDKAPFFVNKLGIQVLPTLAVFKDGKVAELLMGFEDLGGKDEFRTAVLEHWLATQGCIKLKKGCTPEGDCCDDESENSDDDDEVHFGDED